MDRSENLSFGQDSRPAYAPPTITSMPEEEVLEQVGPAQAYAGNLPFSF
jgi:hypothetical protein